MRYLLAIATAALAVVAGCGGSGSSSPPSQGTGTGTATSPAVTSGTSPAPDVAALPTKPGPIAAGRYATATFRPSLAFDLPAGFQLLRPEYEDWLSLASENGSIQFMDIGSAQVIDPKAAANPTVEDLRPPPGDVIAWLTQHPALEVSQPKSVTVAGTPAQEVDVRAAAGLQEDPALFYVHDALLTQPKAAVTRAIVFNSSGHQVVISLLAFEQNLDALAAQAGPLVSSLSIASDPPSVSSPAAGGAACGDVQTFPVVGRNHVETPPPDSTYNSFPPTSGPHYPTPAAWGIYDKPFPQFVLVHNLEHGGIVVQYGQDVSADTVSKMAAWVKGDPDGMLLAPLPQLADKIAVTAWTHLMNCTQFDEQAFSSFRDAFRYKGPELQPAGSYKPTSAA